MLQPFNQLPGNTVNRYRLFLLIAGILFTHLTHAQHFTNVGSPGFSDCIMRFPSLAVSNSGTPYMVYSDSVNNYKATVIRFDGSAWVPLGTPGFSAAEADYTNIAIANDGTVYVSYADASDSNKVTVMKYNGSTWTPVGGVGVSPGYNAAHVAMALDAGGTPYVVYSNGPTSVIKYNGTSWDVVGTAGFSAGNAQYCKIAVDAAGTPYVIYEDAGNMLKATVMKYDGSSWVNVGMPGFSSVSQTQYTSIAIGKDGTPYAAYSDGYNGPATVMKFDGTAWNMVGAPMTSCNWVSLRLDTADVPYVGYQDVAKSRKATVMKFDGSTWTSVDTTGFSAGGSYGNTLAISQNGIPYVAYNDGAAGNHCTVKKFEASLGVTDVANPTTVSVFPNPSHRAFTVNVSTLGQLPTTVTLTNVLGAVIEQRTVTGNAEINLTAPAGVYLLTVSNAMSKKSEKVVVW